MPVIDHDSLRSGVAELIAAAGSTGDEPVRVAHRLVEANLMGHDSHGVGMLPRYIGAVHTGELRPNTAASIVSEDGPMLVVDGGRGYGQVIGEQTMAIGIERARQHGVCVLSLRHSFHLGRIGAWGELCADAGLVSMHHVNITGHGPTVAPYGGIDPRFTTNPYVCTLPPTDNNPATVTDFATSRVAHGKVRVARNKGESIPTGWIIDAEGRPSNDPNDLFASPAGALLSLFDHKGYAMALSNELLAGAVSGGGTCRPELDHEHDTILNNMLSVIFDPARLGGADFYRSETDAMLGFVRSSRPSGPAPVKIPGEPERERLAARTRTGIEVDEETLRQIDAAAASVGLGDAHISSQVS